MSKRNTLYYDKFVYSDFVQDMRGHSYYITGIWMHVLAELWESDTRGRVVHSLMEWAKILALTIEETEAVLRYLQAKKIADIEAIILSKEDAPLDAPTHSALSFFDRAHIVSNGDSNTKVTQYALQEIDVANRRMVRDENIRKNAAKRQADLRYREKHKESAPEDSNGEVTQDVTPSSPDRYRYRDRDRDKELNTSPREGALSNGYDPDKILNREQYQNFLLFWDAWPRKDDKKRAKKAFKKLPQDEMFIQKVIENVNERKENDSQWLKNGGEFIPYPATYLNGARWQDENNDNVRFNF